MLTHMKCPWASLTVFFPAYNEAEALPGLIDRALEVLEEIGPSDYEVIVIDDGSSDGTAAIADDYAAKNKRVRVVHHPRNLGYGAALNSGFAAARCEWVVYTDGDGQFDLGDITKFFAPSGRVDVVLGNRRQRRDHWGRKFNAWAWTALVGLILGLSVRGLDCGFKLFKTDKVRKLGAL